MISTRADNVHRWFVSNKIVITFVSNICLVIPSRCIVGMDLDDIWSGKSLLLPKIHE